MPRDVALVIFGLSAATVAYVLVGYPLLLGGLTRLRRAPEPARRWHPFTVSVILPVRNGERWIRAKLETIFGLEYPRELLQVIVVDDGSTDRTADLVRTFSQGRAELLQVPAGGKAAALNAGVARAGGEILFFTDVRQRLDPAALKSLVSWFADPAVGVVSGELVILEGESHEEADIGLYWRLEKWIRKRLSALHSVMGATGSIYAMRRALAEPLPADTLVDDMHLPIGAYMKGYRVVFDEAARAYDYPTALRSEFSRKVRTLAGNYQIIGAFPKLLLPGHPMWIHFLSHKVGRLVLPFALLLIAGSTPFLPAWLAVIAGCAQVLVYGLAALDPLIPPRTIAKRASSPARTFVVMMLAAARAAFVAVWSTERAWTETRVSTPHPTNHTVGRG